MVISKSHCIPYCPGKCSVLSTSHQMHRCLPLPKNEHQRFSAMNANPVFNDSLECSLPDLKESTSYNGSIDGRVSAVETFVFSQNICVSPIHLCDVSGQILLLL